MFLNIVPTIIILYNLCAWFQLISKMTEIFNLSTDQILRRYPGWDARRSQEMPTNTEELHKIIRQYSDVKLNKTNEIISDFKQFVVNYIYWPIKLPWYNLFVLFLIIGAVYKLINHNINKCTPPIIIRHLCNTLNAKFDHYITQSSLPPLCLIK